jgi:hypothetical protein
MRHYRNEDWADFAREVLPVEQDTAMRRHLESGCQECRRTATLWQKVAVVASQEDFCTPPASAVRLAKSYFVPQPESGPLASLAELMWDSFLQPQLAGVRTLAATPRQLLYRAGDNSIDLRVETITGSSRFSIVGQILNSLDPAQGMGDVAVSLKVGAQYVAQTNTNAFGEFQVEFDGGIQVLLIVRFADQREVWIPVGSFGSESLGGSQ